MECVATPCRARRGGPPTAIHAAILSAYLNDALVTLNASIPAAVEWTTQLKQRDRILPRNPMPGHIAG